MTSALPRARRAAALALAALALAAAAAPAGAAKRPRAAREPAAPPRADLPAPEEHVLDNGMRLLLIRRPLAPVVAGGWVAHVGSANERPGITGISHLFEHMMFKGTRTIGTRDAEKDLRLIEEQERVREAMRAEESKLRAAWRRGEIEDWTRPEAKTPRYRELEAVFDSLVREQRANMIKNEFDQTLQRNGGSFINAFTNEDMTFYFVTVPANKLELWFWMEADRLRNPVFREFYSERDVVYEERRLRTESTPTGVFDESFDAVFWDASPYQWPVVGWPSDVAHITKAQADEYYATYYAPHNITAILVGDFDPAHALALARRYFGAIPRGTRPVPEMITTEPRQRAEKRFYGEIESNPGVRARWHTVAYPHRDVPALIVLQEALNGTTGRLQRNLVLGGIADNARAAATHRKYEGMFEVQAECKEGKTPEELEQAVHAELAKLAAEPLPADELQSVKNRYLANTYRQLTSNFFLLLRYGVAEGLHSWRDADRIDAAVQAVTAADLQRVAKAYFTKENRAVAIWTRKGGAGEDPAVAALPAPSRGMVRQILTRIGGAKDADEVQQILARLEQMAAQTPPEMKPALELIRSKAQARIAELSGASGRRPTP